MNVLVTGDGDPAPHLARLERWNGPLSVVTATTLSGIDLVLALPGGNQQIIDRAREVGVRIAEVADAS